MEPPGRYTNAVETDRNLLSNLLELVESICSGTILYLKFRSILDSAIYRNETCSTIMVSIADSSLHTAVIFQNRQRTRINCGQELTNYLR